MLLIVKCFSRLLIRKSRAIRHNVKYFAENYESELRHIQHSVGSGTSLGHIPGTRTHSLVFHSGQNRRTDIKRTINARYNWTEASNSLRAIRANKGLFWFPRESRGAFSSVDLSSYFETKILTADNFKRINLKQK